MATILIADDEKEIVLLLKIYLETEGFTVLEAFDGAQTERIIKDENIDLLIVDIMMPQKTGYEVIKSVRTQTKGRLIPILVISAKTDVSDRILGLDIGADDYIPKPFEPLEVVAKVKAHLRRMNALQAAGNGTAAEERSDDVLLRAGNLTLNKKECTVYSGTKFHDLTKVEFAVLELFMSEPRRVFTLEQIYERGWGESRIVDDNTIRVTISHLREKIGEAKITNIRGLGYRFESAGTKNGGGSL